MIKNLKKKVVVAMSGGVDSSFAAALLKEEGYDVLGVTIHHYDGNESLESAEEAAKNLEIPWHVLDFTKEFKSIVIDYFCNEYLAGRTPNPCVICNLKIKFGLLWDKAKSLGADYLATGHYAINEYDQKSKKFLLKRRGLGVSLNKRMYVTEINSRQNVITLGDDKDLYKDKLLVKDLNFISGDKLSKSVKAEAKIRYNSKKSPAIISPYGEDRVLINFEKPQRAITPGQSAVLYQGDVVVGGGIIQ